MQINSVDLAALSAERKAKYTVINSIFDAVSEVFPGYAGVIDFQKERVTVMRDKEVVYTISIWGDSPKSCMLDVMRGLADYLQHEL
jgi:hypothetical protein